MGAKVGTDPRSAVVSAGRVWSRGQHRLVRAVAVLDDSGLWALDGAHTCAQWVAGALEVEAGTAREWLRVGHALARLDKVDAAFAAGRLSYAKVRALTRVATVDCQDELCALGERSTAGRLGAVLAGWLAGRETPEQTEERQQRSRSVRWRVEPDGMGVLTVCVPPAEFGVLTGVVDACVVRRQQVVGRTLRSVTVGGEGASADASLPRSVARWPSVAQQRVDALVEVVSGGGVKVLTEVVVHVRGDGCTLDDGTPVPGSVVERIAPESFLRALIHDADGRPINASGRRRHPSTRQKRVIKERDKRCVVCGSTEFLEFDHDPPFEVTGHTVVEETWARCPVCHHARHQHDSRGSGAT